MKRFFVGAALLAMAGAVYAQAFVPRIGHLQGAGSSTWSRAPSDEIAESAQRLAETRTFNLPKGSFEPDAGSFAAVPEVSETPSDSSPLIPLAGAVFGVAVVGVGVGTKSRWTRSRS